MKCPSPIAVKDERIWTDSQMISVPCGKCGACRSNRRADWSFRLSQELKNAKNGYFLTLTYDDDNLPFTDDIFDNCDCDDRIPTLHKRDLQLFIKRLRKSNKKAGYDNFRYYAVGEYGTTTGRPHYHVLGFNISGKCLRKLRSIWKLGHCDIGLIESASIHYVTKFHVNAEKEDFVDQETGQVYQRIHEFATMSRRPGIGKNYIDKTKEYHNNGNVNFVINNGFKQRIPRYYKNKLFDPRKRHELAQEQIENSDRRYWIEYGRLKRLNIADPDHYMQRASYKKAKLVVHKSDKGKL